MKIEIIDDFADGEYDSMVFYDSAVLKQDEDGDWIIRDGTKAGTIAKARYGNDFFETDEVFDEADLEGFVFMCAIEPKKHRETGAVTGSMMVWNTIMKLPVPKKKAKTNGRGTTGELVPGTDAENLDMDLAPEEEEAMRGALG